MFPSCLLALEARPSSPSSEHVVLSVEQRWGNLWGQASGLGLPPVEVTQEGTMGPSPGLDGGDSLGSCFDLSLEQKDQKSPFP